MTQHSQNGEGVEVIQSDRDFAAQWIVIAPANARLIRDGLFDHHDGVQAAAKHRQSLTAREPATADVGREDEIERLRHKLWMIACHATGGGIPEIEGIDRSTNDICVQITASRNLVYQGGKEQGAKEALSRAAPSSGQQDGSQSSYAVVISSGDDLTDRLRTCLFHMSGEITTEMACVLASNLADAIRDDEGDEDWGIRLSLSPSSGHAMAEGERKDDPVMIPRQPTEDMMNAGLYHSSHDATYADVDAIWKGMFDAVALDGGSSISLPAATTPPTTNDAIPAGMVRWDGGDRAPDDWDDGKPLLLRCGRTLRGKPDRWTHRKRPSSYDIIAYTPKPSPTPKGGLPGRGEVERAAIREKIIDQIGEDYDRVILKRPEWFVIADMLAPAEAIRDGGEGGETA